MVYKSVNHNFYKHMQRCAIGSAPPPPPNPEAKLLLIAEELLGDNHELDQIAACTDVPLLLATCEPNEQAVPLVRMVVVVTLAGCRCR